MRFMWKSLWDEFSTQASSKSGNFFLKKIICKYFEIYFIYLYFFTLQVHEGQKHHVCKFCKKAFGESNDLRRHIEWVHEGKKDHICDSCGKAFGKLSSLKRHFQSIHEGIKYPCRLCKKTLGSPRDVKIHIQTVHEGVRKFKCNFCEKSFGRSEHLKRHTDTNHKQFTNQDQD